MKIEDLLRACGSGKFPMVGHNDLGTGRVTTVKETEKAIGCAVRFIGMDYDTWFWDIDGTDKRTRYMKELFFEQ